jgi:hypothetical protein
MDVRSLSHRGYEQFFLQQKEKKPHQDGGDWNAVRTFALSLGPKQSRNLRKNANEAEQPQPSEQSPPEG